MMQNSRLIGHLLLVLWGVSLHSAPVWPAGFGGTTAEGGEVGFAAGSPHPQDPSQGSSSDTVPPVEAVPPGGAVPSGGAVPQTAGESTNTLDGQPTTATGPTNRLDSPLDDSAETFQLPGWIVEQSIYIPYDKLKDKFERTGRGIFVPYDQFDELWRAARRNMAPVSPAESPAPYAIVSSVSHAQLERALVRVRATVTIELLQSGWQQIPLGLNGCAIVAATMDDRACRLIQHDDGGMALLMDVANANTRSELSLEYVVAVAAGGSENRVSWTVPQAAINRWEISIDQSDVDILVTPAVVTSEQPRDTGAADADKRDPQPAEVSRVTALLGHSRTIDLRWTPRSVGAEGLAALITAESRIESDLQPNLLRMRHDLNLNIQRAPVGELQLVVPDQLRIVNVLSDSLKKWQFDVDDRLLKIDLFEGIQGDMSLSIESEQEWSGQSTSSRQIELVPIQVRGATRQPGQLLIRAQEGLRVEVSNLVGLSRVNDGRDLNPEAGPAQLTFQYSAVPFQMRLTVDEWTPLIQAQQRIQASLESRQITTETTFLLNITQRGLFQLSLDIPADLTVVGMRGVREDGHQPVRIEKYEPVAGTPGQWTVQLTAEARGQVALVVQTLQAIADPGIMGAEANPTSLTVRWPQLLPGTAQSLRGRVLLTALDRLNVVIERNALGNFRSLDAAAEFPASGGSSQRFAYEFLTEATGLEVVASLRRPQVFVDQLTTVAVEAGLLRYQVELDYDVRYSAVRDLRIDVPTAFESRLRVTGSLSHQRLEPQPEDVAEGDVAWKLTGAGELLGKQTVQMAWDLPIPEIAVGAKQTFPVKTVRPRMVERTRGQIVLKRSELFDLQVADAAAGLRPLDPTTDLLGGRQVEAALAALEYVGPWELPLEVSRYELFDLKRSNVPRSLIQAVWLRNNQLSVQAVYRIRSVNQRLVIQMPPGFDPDFGFDSAPVRLDGQPISLERGGDNQLIVPLGNRERGQELLLELRYTMPVAGDQIPVPTFSEDCAVQKTILVVYLPYDWAPLEIAGPWSDERAVRGLRWWEPLISRDRRHHRPNFEWIATAAVPASQLAEFETDGRPYRFTTISPTSGREGALRIVKVQTWLLQGLGAAVVLILGIALIRRSWTSRLMVAATLGGIWIVSGLQWPWAVAALEYESMAFAGLAVVGVWLTAGLFNVFRSGTESPNPVGGVKQSVGEVGSSNPHAEPEKGATSHPNTDGADAHSAQQGDRHE